MHRLVHRVVLALLLTLLPFHWSVAATAWYGSHAQAEDAAHVLAVAVDTADGHAAQPGTPDGIPDGAAEEGHACTSDCHLDDPLWISAAAVHLPPQHAGPPHFEYVAPTGSHIPAGPERPDRLRAD